MVAAHVDLAAVALGEEVGHEFDHRVGGEGLTIFDTGVSLEFEAGEGGHDEEITVKIRHGLFDDRDPKVFIWIGFEQVVAYHSLMEVGGDFGHEERIIGVDERLVLPREVRVHGVAEFVRERGDAENFVGVRHHDEGMRARRAPRERAATFAFVGVDVHPAFFERAVAEDADVVPAHREQAFGDPFDRLMERDFGMRGDERRPDVVGFERFEAERFAADLEIAVPGGEILFESFDQGVENIDGDVVFVQHHFEGIGVFADAAEEDVLLDGGGEGGGEGVLVTEQGGVIVFPGFGAGGAVILGHQVKDDRLG